ncbi:hypothetical protein [Pseudomonas sp. SLFW]|uniref:hypothetical protein n=1 Tax=Pseudomonas sp. SLFW TaxID=2683259 RepID=UPI00141320C6|nr:hypothetical protein [Pseudomonas sp. SLFW]NBB09836.1 hypothetical protein [Pseudomonas sp. SLFW]
MPHGTKKTKGTGPFCCSCLDDTCGRILASSAFAAALEEERKAMALTAFPVDGQLPTRIRGTEEKSISGSYV